jgi:hypothetical protein
MFTNVRVLPFQSALGLLEIEHERRWVGLAHMAAYPQGLRSVPSKTQQGPILFLLYYSNISLVTLTA